MRTPVKRLVGRDRLSHNGDACRLRWVLHAHYGGLCRAVAPAAEPAAAFAPSPAAPQEAPRNPAARNDTAAPHPPSRPVQSEPPSCVLHLLLYHKEPALTRADAPGTSPQAPSLLCAAARCCTKATPHHSAAASRPEEREWLPGLPLLHMPLHVLSPKLFPSGKCLQVESVSI